MQFSPRVWGGATGAVHGSSAMFKGVIRSVSVSVISNQWSACITLASGLIADTMITDY